MTPPGQAQQARPGQAQSQQPQPQGTPYNPQQGMNFSAYQPQQPAPQQPQGGGFSAWDPNIANNAQAPRPPAFQASYGQLGGGYSDQPNFQQRDAFISQVNNQLGQMQGQSWQQPGVGAPQFDFARMFGQAGNMVQQGYQNPFSQPQRPGPPPGMAGDLPYGPGDPRPPGWSPPPPPPPGVFY
jgi:hypothetical protein